MSDYFDEFKPIRNRIRKYDARALFGLCVGKLNEVERQPVEKWANFWLPWLLLATMRWIASYGDFKPGLKQPSLDDLAGIMSLVHRLADKSDLLHDPLFGVDRFARSTFHQQFWWQERLSSVDLGRLWLLCGELPNEHVIVRQCQEAIGLTPGQFLELGYLLWAYHHKQDRRIWFSRADLFDRSGVPVEVSQEFLDALSIRLDEGMGDRLEGHTRRIKSPPLQHLEKTPFVRHPILETDRGCTVISRRVFHETLRMYIYDTLLERHDNRFAQEFGRVFEDYFEHGLRYLGAPFFREKEVERALGRDGAVDYVLPCKDATVLIEAKAIEMRPHVKAIPDSEKMTNELRTSVIKGVKQGYRVADALRRNRDGLPLHSRDVFIHLVVTYKPMYLWHGGRAWDEFVGAAMTPDLAAEGVDLSVMPPSNVFYLSVDEFDHLIWASRGDANWIGSKLIELRERNGGEATRVASTTPPGPAFKPRFSMSMHLREYLEGTTPPPHLRDAFERLSDRVEALVVARAD